MEVQTPVFGNTERWDTAALFGEIQERVYDKAGLKLPEELRLRCGAVPGTRGTSKKVLGSYVPAEMATDGVPSIYTSPLVGDNLILLATLVHEGIHAMFPDDHHGDVFGVAARKCGLDGRLTATVPSPWLDTVLRDILKDLGPRPHGAIDPSKRKPQKTYLLRLSCPQGCGPYRATQSVLQYFPVKCSTHGRALIEL